MSDISITATSVLPTGTTLLEHGIAGASVTAGQPVYKEASTGKFKLSDNDNATAEVRGVYGVAMHAAGAGQPLAVALPGSDITLNAVLTAGVDYYLSATAGGICPIADVTSGHDPVRVGYATSTTNLKVAVSDPGVTL